MPGRAPRGLAPGRPEAVRGNPDSLEVLNISISVSNIVIIVITIISLSLSIYIYIYMFSLFI